MTLNSFLNDGRVIQEDLRSYTYETSSS